VVVFGGEGCCGERAGNGREMASTRYKVVPCVWITRGRGLPHTCSFLICFAFPQVFAGITPGLEPYLAAELRRIVPAKWYEMRGGAEVIPPRFHAPQNKRVIGSMR
jgi:hypothetical protein